MASYTVETRRGIRSVESTLSHADAAGICATLADDFARSLADQYRGGRRPLSAKQLSWLHVMAIESQRSSRPAPAAQPAPAAPKAPEIEALVQDELQAEAILAMFKGAASRLQTPAIELFDGQATYRLFLTDRGAHPGTVIVKSNGRYLGRIMGDGIFIPDRAVTNYPGLIPLLRAFGEDPAKVAKEYGGRTGRCCFCRLKLTDARSTEVGYGPICAGHWNLPWGNKPGRNTAE